MKDDYDYDRQREEDDKLLRRGIGDIRGIKFAIWTLVIVFGIRCWSEVVHYLDGQAHGT